MRRYGLYYKIGRRHYRVRSGIYPKAIAIQVHQDGLLNGLLWHANLRPTEGNDPLYHVLVAAYGRKYETPAAALTDWHGGKDFQNLGGPYCSKRDKIFGLIRLDDASRTLIPVEGTAEKEEEDLCEDTPPTA